MHSSVHLVHGRLECHYFSIRPNCDRNNLTTSTQQIIMYTTNNALALVMATPKLARKASDISKSPHHDFNVEVENWPSIKSTIPLTTPTSRSQGSAKRGKSNPPTSNTKTQHKLDTFFALAKQPTILSPPKLSSLGATRSSASNLSEKPNNENLNNTDPIMEKAPADAGKEGEKARSDPPAKENSTTPKSKKTNDIMDSDDDNEPPLSNIKLRPKSKSTPAKVSAKKSRKTPRSSVKFIAVPTVNLVVEPEEAPPLPTKIDHPFHTVVTATVWVNKVKDTFTNFIKKLTNTINFLRTQVDDTIAIVPKSKEMDDDHIIDKPSFPRVVFKLNQRHFNIETRGAFTDATKTQTGRMIKLSLVLGSTVEINHQLLEEICYDTQKMQVNFWYKPHQEVDTVARLVFLGAPNNANKDEVAEIITSTLQPLEKHLVETDPSLYPPEVFNLPWPKFAIVSEQPIGQPYTKPELGPNGKPQSIFSPSNRMQIPTSYVQQM